MELYQAAIGDIEGAKAYINERLRIQGFCDLRG